MAMKAELMQQERSRIHFENYRAAGPNDKPRTGQEVTARSNRYNNDSYQEDKAAGKRHVNEGREKEVQKADPCPC